MLTSSIKLWWEEASEDEGAGIGGTPLLTLQGIFCSGPGAKWRSWSYFLGGSSCRKVPGGAVGGSGSLVPRAGSRFQEFLPRKQIAHDKYSITVYSQEKKYKINIYSA